jgi:hypothetical protein
MYAHFGSTWPRITRHDEPDLRIGLTIFRVPILEFEFVRWGYLCFTLFGFFFEVRLRA